MGRKSLLTSTKKKTTKNKKKPGGAVAKKATDKEKTVAVQKTKAVNAAPSKAKAKPVSIKNTKTKKAPAKNKKSAPAKKKWTLKELLFKQFETKGIKPQAVKLKNKEAKIPAAPPFVSGFGEKETNRIRALLFKSFDLKEPAMSAGSVEAKKAKTPTKKAPAKKKEAAKTKKEAPPKKKAVAKTKKAAPTKKRTLKDLLFQQFEVAGTKPKVAQVKKKAVKIPEAPPFVSGYGKEETERIRALLYQKFDLTQTPLATSKKAAPQKKETALTGKALLFKQFKAAPVAPIKLTREPVALPDAPPFFSGTSKEESEKVRALLFKSFSAAALKTVSAQAKAPEPVSYEPAPSSAASDSVAKGKTFVFLLLAALVAILIGSSYANRNHYFLKEADGVVQVWRGKFAPTGEEMLLTMDGVSMPQDVKPVYTKTEISPIVFDYMMGKADSILDAPRGPDFGAIKQHLRQAKEFAPAPMLQNRVENRLRSIDFVVLFHKADIAIGKGALADMMQAKAYLNRARSVAFTDYQRDMVTRAEVVVEEAISAPGK